MTVAFWIVSALLALVFLAAGAMKATRSREALAANGLAWTEDFSDGTVKLIGVLEVLGAIGVILPALVDVAPILSPIAATCLALVMIPAIAVHVRRKESAVPAIVLLVVSVVAAVLGFAYVS